LFVGDGPGPHATSAQTPTVSDDRSLTVNEAAALKLPPFDRVWKDEDYDAAAIVLTRLGTADPQRLPRYQSPRSGELFARLTATDHFAAFNDKSVPIETRMPNALKQLQSIQQFTRVYSRRRIGRRSADGIRRAERHALARRPARHLCDE